MTERNIQVLFIGKSISRIAWYRCVLPAMYLGCDWMGVSGEPPNLRFATGLVKGDTQMARFEDYDVIVAQQPAGHGWFNLIGRLQSRGIPVVYEIDDYAHGIRKDRDHDFAAEYPREALRAMELCMRRADGMIVTTDYLARRYARFNKRIWVCPNGLDMGRYRLSRPTRRPYVLPVGVVELPLYGGAGRRRDGRFGQAHERVGEAFIDAADLDLVGGHRWLLHPHGYAYRREAGRSIYLHRELMGEPEGRRPGQRAREVDHLNGDRRDNRRDNLDVVTQAENKARRMRRPGDDDRGVLLNARGKWSARVETPDGTVWLGHTHATKAEAQTIVAAYRAEHLPSLPAPDRIKHAITIMWAGATGHTSKLVPWLEVVARVMTRHRHVRFASIGHPIAQMIESDRSIAIPFSALETYPSAMMVGDIALAPGGTSGFYRAKSPLRAMEAGALGIPVVADPDLYGTVVIDGQTGLLASTPAEAEDALERLVADHRLRLKLGNAARKHVAATYDMRVMVEYWKRAIIEALDCKLAA